jgi:hypothetical protein
MNLSNCTMTRFLLFAALSLGALLAQTKMSVQQLAEFLSSSVKLHQPDKQVADYLKKVSLSQKLDEDSYSSLLALGLGDKTSEALRVLYDGSRSLPTGAPLTAAAKPKSTIPPPTSLEQAKLIAETRDYALNYSRNLPNFICTQVTRRFADPTGLEFWQRQDQIVAQLTFFDQKEDYKVKLVDNQVVDTTIDRIGGTTSSGEFGSMLKEIFDPKTAATFEWLRWATLGGRRTHVLGYRVVREKGDMSIGAQTESGAYQTTKAGYTGLVYIERASGLILRITQEAENIDPGFPVQQAGRVLDYDTVDIAGAKHILPIKFTTRLRSGKLLTKNEVEFRAYRKYGTDANIVFDTDALESETSEDRVETPATNPAAK